MQRLIVHRGVSRHIQARGSLTRIASSNEQHSHNYEERSGRHSSRIHFLTVPIGLLSASALIVARDSECDRDHESGVEFETHQKITNWSGTHTCSPMKVYEPKNSQEVTRLLQSLYRSPYPLKTRPIGTSLSPNGIGMSDNQSNLISTAHLDHITVDKANKLVTVGGGIRVSDVLKELEKHGLTLENFSSIQEQQMAGWTQVAAHGTGATLPTVDDMIVRMKIATPTLGLLTLSADCHPSMFTMAKVGLGSLGIVTELTLKCTERHSLLEHTYSTMIKDIANEHYDRLAHYRHVRYMWLPYTSQVVVVVSNPTESPQSQKPIKADPVQSIITRWRQEKGSDFRDQPTKPLVELLINSDPLIAQEISRSSSKQQIVDKYRSELNKLSFSQLRDRLIAIDSMNIHHIAAVNRAEAEFWKASTGTRCDDSTKILGFDCGGEQYVYEICFPIGTLANKSNKDIEFVTKLTKIIEEQRICAPCPIEQRWTSRSTSKMSPAYSANENDIFSWIGIIMYIPQAKEGENPDEMTEMVREKFHKYVNAIKPLCEEYGAVCHWAKIEIPKYIPPTDDEKQRENQLNWFSNIFSSVFGGQTNKETPSDATLLRDLRQSLRKKYPIDEFNTYRKVLDPKGILSNQLIDTLFAKENE